VIKIDIKATAMLARAAIKALEYLDGKTAEELLARALADVASHNRGRKVCVVLERDFAPIFADDDGQG
jgi:hypothetical protein